MASTKLYVVIIFSLFIKHSFPVSRLDERYSQKRIKRSQSTGPTHITEKYKNAASRELLETHHSFDRKPMSRLTMSCKSKAYKMIMSDYPFAEVRWKHNGENFALQPSRMVTGLNSVTIQNLMPEDSGVYHCVLTLSKKVHIIVAVFSVVVGNETKHVTKGDTVKLECHGNELGKIFKQSTRMWTDPKRREQFRKSAIDKTQDVIKSADEKSAGLWLCQVEDRSTNRAWKTARIEITVGPAPTGWKKLVKYSKTHKVETVAIMFAATFVLVLIMNCLTKIVEWKQKKFKSELDEIQKVLGITEENLGADNIPLLLREADDNITGNGSSDEESCKS
ncbi:uncharacterized protein LOC123530258 [Mercenaria mercenaria]|uniref:uncharacterized protein LOC123530258 n=1 Tax=Mercenaria mercenaria TaxID=6596 RepID=UPI00234F0F8D|nr:uncharacterized protein LOC123530258 [Mercenaria mercenaria]